MGLQVTGCAQTTGCVPHARDMPTRAGMTAGTDIVMCTRETKGHVPRARIVDSEMHEFSLCSRHVLIDEFQDVTEQQLQLLRLPCSILRILGVKKGSKSFSSISR